MEPNSGLELMTLRSRLRAGHLTCWATQAPLGALMMMAGVWQQGRCLARNRRPTQSSLCHYPSSLLASPPSFSAVLVSFPWVFKDPDGKIHFIWVIMVGSWRHKFHLHYTGTSHLITVIFKRLSWAFSPRRQVEEGKGGKAKSSDEGEVRGQRGRNQLGYLPSFICSLLASARTVLRQMWLEFVTEKRLRGQDRYLCMTFLVLLAYSCFFIHIFNQEFVEALLG